MSEEIAACRQEDLKLVTLRYEAGRENCGPVSTAEADLPDLGPITEKTPDLLKAITDKNSASYGLKATKEIGTRKAIGARKSDIMMQFLIESVVMTLSGGLLGILIGAGISSGIFFFAGWAVKVSPLSVTLATTFSVLIGVCFGLWPAHKAAQLHPVEALRYE